MGGGFVLGEVGGAGRVEPVCEYISIERVYAGWPALLLPVPPATCGITTTFISQLLHTAHTPSIHPASHSICETFSYKVIRARECSAVLH